MNHQPLLTALVISAIASSIPIAAAAQTGRLVSSGCRQGYCWETFLQGQQVIHQNRLAGVDNTLYEVSLESHNTTGIEQRTQWVYCSTSQPFVAFDWRGDPDDLLYLHDLNPGGNSLGSYNADSHLLYWAVCHNVWEPEVWSPENGLANLAQQLGYSLTLDEGQREIPKAMFR